jgi:hypothetical protein
MKLAKTQLRKECRKEVAIKALNERQEILDHEKERTMSSTN